MKKLLFIGTLFTFGISYSENLFNLEHFEKRLEKLAEMHAKECSPAEFAYAEVYLESLKNKRASNKESIDTISYPTRIDYYLSIVEKNIYSDKDQDGIPCYKEVELGLNPDVYDKVKKSKEEKREDTVITKDTEKKDSPVMSKGEETVDPLNQPVRIHFYLNSADIRKEYLPYLNVVVNFLKMHSDIKIKIVGYTDDIGSKSYNDKLALKRATAVKNYLVKNGINPSRVVIEGIGKDGYLVSNDKGIDRFTNRRAEFYVIKLAK